MLPTVARMTGLDIYRDGGSLSASFQDQDKNEYTLFFPVDHESAMANVPRAKKRFRQPILKKHIRSEYKSPITGVVSPKWEEEQTLSSWNDACILLERMEPKLGELVSDYHYVFKYMQEAAAKNGGE